MFELKLPEIMVPSDEELAARRHERCVAPLHRARERNPDMDLFSAISLSGWSRLAQDAGIALVPAERVCSVPVEVVMRFENPQPSDLVHVQPLLNARAALKSDEMLRWDCCASLDMKDVMSHGSAPEYALRTDRLNPQVPVWRTLEGFDDPRFMDIIMECPVESVDVIKRPWIEARREGTHPVEYRVFVANGRVEAVANYYIQRNLPLSDEVRQEVSQAISSTQKLIGHMERVGSLPFNLGVEEGHPMFDSTKASFTADYLVSQEGQVLFLEAGPPFGLGAHPCAFMENIRTVDGRSRLIVQGVCLGVGQEPLPLEQFECAPSSGPRP